MGWSIFWFFVILYFVLKILAGIFRRRNLCRKYGLEIAEKILRKTVWVGETAEQLVESLGHPIDIDENVLKTKKREIWKYYSRGTNRYGLRVKVENGEVVGWDEKL